MASITVGARGDASTANLPEFAEPSSFGETVTHDDESLPSSPLQEKSNGALKHHHDENADSDDESLPDTPPVGTPSPLKVQEDRSGPPPPNITAWSTLDSNTKEISQTATTSEAVNIGVSAADVIRAAPDLHSGAKSAATVESLPPAVVDVSPQPTTPPTENEVQSTVSTTLQQPTSASSNVAVAEPAAVQNAAAPADDQHSSLTMWKGLQMHIKSIQGGKARQGCTWYTNVVRGSMLVTSVLAYLHGRQEKKFQEASREQATKITQMLADQRMLIPANDIARDGVSDSRRCLFYISGTAAEGAVGLV